MPRQILNAVQLSTSSEAKIQIRTVPYEEKLLADLRCQNIGSHIFRRDHETEKIQCVAVRPDAMPIGEVTAEQVANEAPWLINALALDALTRLFHGLGRTLLRRRPLRLLSEKPENLLPQGFGLPDWLQKRLLLEFDTRITLTNSGRRIPILLCTSRIRNIIEVDIAELIRNRLSVQGKYVCAPQADPDTRIAPRLHLLGRIAKVRGETLLLDETLDGSPKEVRASDVFLEPRAEVMDACIQHYAGGKAARVFAQVEEMAARHIAGSERLATLERTFAYLRKQNLELAPAVPLLFGEPIGKIPSSWPFRSETLEKPLLLFDPSGSKTSRWNEGGLDQYGPFDQRSFSPKSLRVAVICQSVFEGQVDNFLAKFFDGMPDITVGNRKPYAKGFIRRFGLERPNIRTFTIDGNSAKHYSSGCRRVLEGATDDGRPWDLVLVQIDRDFRDLPSPTNPYYITRAAFLKHRIPVQHITLDTIRFLDGQLVFAVNNMSVATYAKVGGIPWLLKAQPTVAHELIIGLGSQTTKTSRFGSGERMVGITTMFRSDGRYILDDRTTAVPYSEYRDALFKSLKRSIEKVRDEDNWRSTDAVRLIFHVFKQMADDEAAAVDQLITELGFSDVKYAFVHLVDYHPFVIFDETNQGVGRSKKGVFAPERGTIVHLNRYESLVSFVGAKEVKDAKHGMPIPTLLRLHHRSTFTDMTYITRQAFDFSCHSWRMLFPAPLPITVHYSELIAKQLAGLQEVPSWDPDIMLGQVSRTKWFL